MTTKTWHYAPVARCSLPVLMGKAAVGFSANNARH